MTEIVYTFSANEFVHYECHITMEGGDPNSLKIGVEGLGWKFSKIDGDPTLGIGVKCYATKHFSTKKKIDEVKAEMEFTASMLPYVIRQKIELVIYDSTK